jgi:hypothetical protein
MNPPDSPREILLARHAPMRPALDAQRAALLARFASPVPAIPPAPGLSIRHLFVLLHRELFVPYRRAWSTLACVWVALLLGLKIEHLASPVPPAQPITATDRALLALWAEQRRQLANLPPEAFDAWPGSTPFRPPGAPTEEPTSLRPRPLGALSAPRPPLAVA